MRTLALFLLLVLLSGCAGAFQSPSDMSDQIRVQTSDDSETAYRTAARALLNAGYTLAETDETFLAVKTDYRGLYKLSVLRIQSPRVQISFVVTDDTPATVVYRATLRPSAESDQTIDVVDRAMATDVYRDSWTMLEEAAATYPGGVATPTVGS